MQTVVCFTTKQDEFGGYIFNKEFFPDNKSPYEYFESNKGLYRQVLSIVNDSVTYVIYGLGEFNEAQKAQLREDWQRYCT